VHRAGNTPIVTRRIGIIIKDGHTYIYDIVTWNIVIDGLTIR